MLDSAKGRQIEVEATGPQEEKHWPPLSPSLILVLMKINLLTLTFKSLQAPPTIRKARTESFSINVICTFCALFTFRRTLENLKKHCLGFV